MNLHTRHMQDWLKDRPKLTQWLWFIGLWLAGLLAVFLVTWPFRMVIDGIE